MWETVEDKADKARIVKTKTKTIEEREDIKMFEKKELERTLMMKT